MAYIRSNEYAPILAYSGCDASRWTTRCRTQDFGLAPTGVRQVWNAVVRPDWVEQALHDVPSPPLIKRETQPPSSTLYVNIALGSEGPARPMTGIFIPDGYRPLRWVQQPGGLELPQPEVDLILWLMGHHTGLYGQPPPKLAIDTYWSRAAYPYWMFREGVNDSRRRVILIAPTLGPSSEAGWLTKAGGFDTFLDQVMAALTQYGPYSAASTPRVRNIILACHSGGGAPMRQLAMARPPQRYTPQIRECWGFDCLYDRGDELAWGRGTPKEPGWAASHPDAKLYIYYGDGGTDWRSEQLRAQRLPNVSVEGSTRLGHYCVPMTYWRERIQGAPFLEDVGSGSFTVYPRRRV